MILAEPRGARAAFLREVCAELGLKDVEVYAHKVGPDYPGQVGGVITRAVGPIPETLDRVASCLAPGGRMIFMKGPECDHEVAEAAADARGIVSPGGRSRVCDSRHDHRRRLVVYERLEGEVGRERSRRSSREPAERRHIRRRDPGNHQRLESDVSALSRPPARARDPQARRGDPGRHADLLRGPGSVPRTCPGLADVDRRPTAAG